MKKEKQVSGSRLNRIPLWSQLVILVTIVTTLLISLILVRDYRQNKASVMEQHIATSRRLLELEMQNLEQYVKDLVSFCLQPIYDSEFNLAIKSRAPFSSAQENYVKEQIRTYYYTRTDLTEYEIYFSYQDRTYGRAANAQHVTWLAGSTLPSEDGFAQCSTGKYYNAIEPASRSNGFFSYYQSIIRIQDQTPEAVVKLEVDNSFAASLNQEHLSNGEFICIFNTDGELLFSGNKSLISEQTSDSPGQNSDAIERINSTGDGDHFLVTMDGASYLGVICHSNPYGLKMATFLPMAAIDAEISSILKTNVLTGVLLWAVASLLIFFLLRITTNPLTRLSNHMQQVGDGNFMPVTGVGGSREISDLAANFNDMISHIDSLIRQNYLSEINEKTSRLTALEAQLNPHFLYNTLQAIGTEALLNDQPQINQMITSLASNLRYSIKGGDLVQLKSEITYVKNYVMLQKMRLEDRLIVDFDVDEQLMDMLVPKISVQTLVENSIIHGMGPDTDSIRIQIQTRLSENMLTVTVSDDGCGISPEQLKKMQEDFQHFLKPGTAGKIGLANLYSRLQILYQEHAALHIESTLGEGTCITMQIPNDPYSQKGVYHVQSTDRR